MKLSTKPSKLLRNKDFIWLPLFAFVLLFFSGCKSRQLEGSQSSSPAKKSSYNHLLWKVEGAGLTSPSYLYGTIHIIPQKDFHPSDILLTYFDQADKLVMEMDMDVMDPGAGGEDIDFSEMMSMLSELMLKPPNSLKSLLPEEDYEYLQGFMRDSMPTPVPFYQMFKPIFLSEQISVSYCMEEMPNSFELFFRQKAKDQEMPIAGLETFEDQLSFIQDIPLEEQAASLMETVRNAGSLCQEYQRMYDLYNAQRLDSLMLMVNEDPTLKEQSGNLLDNRNSNWIPKLREWMPKESLFVAVGAAHLPGPKGVVELLREAGYTVTPISLN